MRAVRAPASPSGSMLVALAHSSAWYLSLSASSPPVPIALPWSHRRAECHSLRICSLLSLHPAILACITRMAHTNRSVRLPNETRHCHSALGSKFKFKFCTCAPIGAHRDHFNCSTGALCLISCPLHQSLISQAIWHRTEFKRILFATD